MTGIATKLIPIGRFVSVRNLKDALEHIGCSVDKKKVLITQVHSSVPAVAQDNYILQFGDFIEFETKKHNVKPDRRHRREKGMPTTVKIGSTFITISEGYLWFN